MATSVSSPRLNTSFNGYYTACSVWPVYCQMNGERRQIGYEVELLASHSADPDHLDPGCLACNRLRNKLLTIANAVVASISPSLRESVRCESHARDASSLFWPRLGNRSLVSVSISISHRHGFDRPIDQSEIATLDEIKNRLAELGVQYL